MKNKVTVTIAGREYTLLAAEEDAYIKQMADYVDEQIQQAMDGGRSSLMDAALLAALNIADAFHKEQQTSEHLRLQLKECLDETESVKQELSEAKRKIFKMQSKPGK